MYFDYMDVLAEGFYMSKTNPELCPVLSFWSKCLQNQTSVVKFPN